MGYVLLTIESTTHWSMIDDLVITRQKERYQYPMSKNDGDDLPQQSAANKSKM
jgi:hypothetical protein